MNGLHVMKRRQVSIFAVILFITRIGDARASDASTLPATTLPAATLPATTAITIDWNQRIDDALRQKGSVEDVAAELRKEPSDAPDIFRARFRAFIEQGDIPAATAALTQRVKADNSEQLIELARCQEMLISTAEVESTLRAAVAASTTSSEMRSSSLRLATLLLDEGRREDGRAVLERLVQADPSASRSAGGIAYLFGDWFAAARYLRASVDTDVARYLLEGMAALHAGRTDSAAAAFTAAFERASVSADRQYAQDRLIAAARQAGTLPKLADDWLAQADLPSDRLLPLAIVLRELNRAPDLLRWWRSQVADPARAEVVLSNAFIRAVLGAAQSAERLDDVLAICREMLNREPDSAQWLSANLRTLLDQGKFKEADELLALRLNAAATSPERLEAIGKIARSFGRDDVAVDAGKRIATFGGDAEVDGLLLVAAAYQSAGKQPEAFTFLRMAAAAAQRHPTKADAVVNALEAAHLPNDAVQLLTSITTHEPNDDLLNRLASLLIEQHRPREAIPFLERVLHSSASVALRGQAGQQLLQAAKAAGTLNELIARLQARIGNGEPNGQDLSLLIDAYMRSGKLDSAVNLLKGSKSIDELDRLRRLSVLFLRAKDSNHAIEVLGQLAVADPRNATETLERLASVALAAGDTKTASITIKALEQHVGHDQSSLTLMAGVFERLGRAEDAARLYRQAVAADPADGDTWLQWAAAMSKSGKAMIASQRLLYLCYQADTDNLFATAADGLLNLNAPAAMLRAARREAMNRVAIHPGQMLLYHIIADLSEELQDTAMRVRSAEATVAISTAERPQTLRDLMDVASQNGLIETAADCGESLLSLGDDLPPQSFLQLGEQQLIAGRRDDAARAFARAAEASTPDVIAQRAGALSEKYGFPAAALNALSPLIERRRGDLALIDDVARLDEILGRHESAFTLGLRAVRIAAQALPAAASNTAQTVFAGQPPAQQLTAFHHAVGDAMFNARTPESRSALADLLMSELKLLMPVAPRPQEPPPNVSAVAAAVRRVAFAANLPDLADSADDLVIASFPAAVSYKVAAMDSRRENELPARSDRFAARAELARANPAAPTTMPAHVTLESAARALPMLITHGDFDEAKRIIESIPLARPAVFSKSAITGALPVQTVLTAAVALDQPDAATQWALQWLGAGEPPVSTTASTSPASAAAARFRLPNRLIESSYQAIDGAWPLLAVEGRFKLVDQLTLLASRATDVGVRSVLLADAVQLAADLPDPRPGGLELAAAAIATPSYDPVLTAVRAFGIVPATDRPKFLALALQHAPKNARLSLLLSLVAKTADPFDPATLAAMSQAAQEMPDKQAVAWSEWFANSRQQAVLAPLAEAVLRCGLPAGQAGRVGPSAAQLAAAAAAFSNAGMQERADALAAQAIAIVQANLSSPDAANDAVALDPSGRAGTIPDRIILLRTAAAALSADARIRLLAQSAHETMTSSEAAVRAVLLDSAGQRVAALDALRDASAHSASSDLTVLYLYADRLHADRRAAELVENIASRADGLDGAMGVLIRGWVTESLNDLFRGRESHAETPPNVYGQEFTAAALTNDLDRSSAALRTVLRSLRTSPAVAPRIEMPNVGGLSLSNKPESDATVMLAQCATWPGSIEDLLAAVELPVETRNSPASEVASPWLAMVLSRAAENDAGVRDRVLADVQTSAAAETMTRGKRLLTMKLAPLPGVQLPPALLESFIPAAIADETGTEASTLADALAARHDPLSAGVKRWADAVTLSSGRSTANVAATLNPLRPLTDESVAAWLSQLSRIDPTAAERQFAVMRRTGRVTAQFTHCHLLWARLAAERGDFTAYQARLTELLQARCWTSNDPRFSAASQTIVTDDPDIREALRGNHLDSQQKAGLLAAIHASLSAFSARWPGNISLIKNYAEAGQWAHDQNDDDAARQLLERAVALCAEGNAGSYLLSVADLARLLGDDRRADDMELELLRQRCLPSMRIAPLLARVERRGDSHLAADMAKDAAKYCRHPIVLRMAGGPKAS